MALILFFIGCESDSIILDSSFTENNSLFSISFPLNSIPENTNTFQDSLHSNGDSYRLYAGEIDSYIDNSDFITSEILFKINLDDFRESKYCNLDNTNLKYLAPIPPILFYKYKSKINSKLVNLINLDKANPKYLAPIYPILL